jgi:hypothetical protein
MGIQTKPLLFIIIGLSLSFFSKNLLADNFLTDTDRGYREPAVEGPAILDEDFPPNLYNNFNARNGDRSAIQDIDELMDAAGMTTPSSNSNCQR